ncbi:MAG: hypothetical protein PHP50_10870 [Lachnospiraceae bacterium]|nr:hypothetical protein [Lachnospiraceae bacterium]
MEILSRTLVEPRTEVQTLFFYHAFQNVTVTLDDQIIYETEPGKKGFLREVAPAGWSQVEIPEMNRRNVLKITFQSPFSWGWRSNGTMYLGDREIVEQYLFFCFLPEVCVSFVWL